MFNVCTGSHQDVGGYNVFTVGHPAVSVGLKVARPIAYLLTPMLTLAHKQNQVYVYFIRKSHGNIETVTF